MTQGISQTLCNSPIMIPSQNSPSRFPTCISPTKSNRFLRYRSHRACIATFAYAQLETGLRVRSKQKFRAHSRFVGSVLLPLLRWLKSSFHLSLSLKQLSAPRPSSPGILQTNRPASSRAFEPLIKTLWSGTAALEWPSARDCRRRFSR